MINLKSAFYSLVLICGFAPATLAIPLTYELELEADGMFASGYITVDTDGIDGNKFRQPVIDFSFYETSLGLSFDFGEQVELGRFFPTAFEQPGLLFLDIVDTMTGASLRFSNGSEGSRFRFIVDGESIFGTITKFRLPGDVAVPEPGTLALFLFMLATLAVTRFKSKTAPLSLLKRR